MLSGLSLNIHVELHVVVWMLEMRVSGGFSCNLCRI